MFPEGEREDHRGGRTRTNRLTVPVGQIRTIPMRSLSMIRGLSVSSRRQISRWEQREDKSKTLEGEKPQSVWSRTRPG